MTLSPGSKLGPYEILSSIGSGGMGEVWKARDTRLGRIVAIKKVKEQHSERFKQEARSIAALNHPNICQIHDIGDDYLVLEYVEGKPLYSPLPEQEAVRLAIQIATALEEAHQHGIIHRDLKPSNILVTDKGTVKLLDFGLAKLYEQDQDTSNLPTADFPATQAGAILGTVAYMSPEQAQGQPADARSDIFSFGLVLYEVLSGKRAFSGDSTPETMAALLRDEPAPLKASPQLEKIVKHCLEKKPSDRYQRMSELKVDLVKATAKKVTASSEEPQPSIAVLPFVNMSGDKEQEYFSDGLAEEIINALTKIPGLQVIARTSAFAFKGKNEDIRKIADVLGVANILEGSVRKSGNRIRVTAQLIETSKGIHLWSERYDRDMTDVFAIQDEISQAIADKLRVQLSDDKQLVKQPTKNLEAYNLYLKGRYHYYSKGTPEAWAKAKEYYEAAVAVDPNYALAWFGISMYYWLMGFGGFIQRKLAYAESRKAALKASDINPMLPENHAMIGALQAIDYNWKEAEKEFRLGLKLDPESVEILVNYSWFYLTPMRRLNDAIAAMKKVLEFDPLSEISHLFLGWFYSFIGQWDQSIGHFQNVLELDPNHYQAHRYLGLAFIENGMVDEGIRTYKSASEILGISPILAYAKAGKVQKALALLEKWESGSNEPYVPALFAQVYFALGEIDQGFDWMEKAVEDRDQQIYYIHADMKYDPLRSHPRYKTLLQKMNLEP
jgi:serine/threonine protein kinase/Tfp pilus assembly protein PilF